MAGTDEETLKPWRWPGQWFRQEAFWRDVGSRTLSALLAGGLAYIAAIGLGYARRPGVWQIVAGASAVIVAGSLIALVFIRLSANSGRHDRLSDKGTRRTPSRRSPRGVRNPSILLAIAGIS